MGSAPYISSVIFDNALDEASYLQRLPIIKHLAAHRELSFNAPVT
ncbi:MAG: ABC transporter ATP-binding protein, partial [Ruminococcaceae bacterium]|nr:ABC transporter ATP-binding protein [Oscillospiraceae bacterium]